jgi:predicted permease
VIAIALASLLALLIGTASEHRFGDTALSLSNRLLDLLAFVALPIVVFFSVNSLAFTKGVSAGLAFGWTERIVVILLAWLIGSRILRLPRAGTGAMMIAAGIANTGHLGIPVIAFLLGSDQIPLAVTYDTAVTAPLILIGGFAIGAAFGERAGSSGLERLRSFVVRNPALLALIAALLLPSSFTPTWAHDTATFLAVAIAPIGFFALGVNLMLEHDQEGTRIFPPELTAPVAISLVLRLLVAPAVMLSLSNFVVEVPTTFLVQAGMASGITGLAIGHIFGLNMKIIVGAIAWSTAIVIVAASIVALTGWL